MKCVTCGKKMNYMKKLKFNNYILDGWKCSCGEIYFNPEQAQRILLLNKIKKEHIKVKLGRMRSNLILRLPKEIETALGLHKGEKVTLKVRENEIKIVP